MKYVLWPGGGADVHGLSGAPVSRSGSGVTTMLCIEIFYSDRPFATVVRCISSRTVECNMVLLPFGFDCTLEKFLTESR